MSPELDVAEAIFDHDLGSGAVSNNAERERRFCLWGTSTLAPPSGNVVDGFFDLNVISITNKAASSRLHESAGALVSEVWHIGP